MLGNPHGMSCDGRQDLPSAEETENARHSLSLTPGISDTGGDVGSVNLGLLSRILTLEPVAKKQGTFLNSF